ncbi:MAG: PHP domain-containing protein [Balneolaceae bacterium]|nr:PHP domain-containing protein [Balneolaceae bacterium]
MDKADLHIHTTASDGKSSPEEILALADRMKLACIAITDHDTLDGYREAKELSGDYEVELIPGIEITAGWEGRECHLLAYAFDPAHESMAGLCRRHRRARLERGKWIIEQLSREGIDLDIEEVKVEASWGNIGRPHIASLLVKKGYVASPREAFIRYLGDHALGPIENDYFDFAEAVRRVKEAGGAAVLAHPGKLYSPHERRELAGLGLDGIEVIHPSHDWETQKELESFAEQQDLLVTGGSDFHGEADGYHGRFGVVAVARSHADRLQRLAASRQPEPAEQP